MCLIVFAVRTTPEVPLVVLANRDELHRRPTAAAQFWDDVPSVLAGRDLEQGGTWLGIDRRGRWAAVTNYREPGQRRGDALSRGELVAGYLEEGASPRDWAEGIAERGRRYNGFSLLVGHVGDVWFVSNRGGGPHPVEAGVHGLSNHLLDTPWPKVERLREGLRESLQGPQPPKPWRLLTLLDDRCQPPDEELPDTGVGLELERLLSSPLIVSPEYGTRSSTVLMIQANGQVSFVERQLDPEGATSGLREFDFHLQP